MEGKKDKRGIAKLAETSWFFCFTFKAVHWSEVGSKWLGGRSLKSQRREPRRLLVELLL